MNIKEEYTVTIQDDVESGQCSDDEVEVVKKEKKVKKHKKRDKPRKSRKRRHTSSSESECSNLEFFNPYSVNPMKFCVKAEFVQMTEESNVAMDTSEFGINNGDVTSDLFNNLNEVNGNCDINSEFQLSSQSHLDELRNSSNETDRQHIIDQRASNYLIDISGIDTVTSDLYHYLMDLGLSSDLVNAILQVFSKEDSKEDMLSNHDDQDGYEEEMINEIPIIDQPVQSEDSCCYSPEHANDLVEPYQPLQLRPNVAYAPAFQNNTIRTLSHIIDPLSIPAVGPRDPRLIQTKTLLQMKPVSIVKPIEVVNDKEVQKTEVNPVITREWEVTVINVVKTHLRLYLMHNDINKEEYKSILKRAVSKILTSGEKKLETDKISKFLHSYVMLIQKSRINNV